MADCNVAVEILKDIRDEIRGTNARLDTTNRRLDKMGHALSQRLGAVETTLLELAEQQRFVARTLSDQ